MKKKHWSTVWDVFSVGVLGLNSFLMLFYKPWLTRPVRYVVCAGALGYVLVMMAETILLWRHDQRRAVAYKIRRVFRFIYAAIYAAALMIHILTLLQEMQSGYRWQTAWFGILFILDVVWATNFRWIPRLKRKVFDSFHRLSIRR